MGLLFRLSKGLFAAKRLREVDPGPVMLRLPPPFCVGGWDTSSEPSEAVFSDTAAEGSAGNEAGVSHSWRRSHGLGIGVSRDSVMRWEGFGGVSMMSFCAGGGEGKHDEDTEYLIMFEF